MIYRECREILIPYPGPDLKYNHYYCFKVWLRSSTWNYQEQSSKWLPWENCWHLVMPLTVSPPNDMWETCAEIPYWWRVTTQIWVVLLIGWIKFPMARSIRSTTQIPSSVWNFCTSFSDVKPVVVSPLKCQPFSPAIQEVFVKVNLAQFNPSGFLSAKFPACPKKKGCLTL